MFVKNIRNTAVSTDVIGAEQTQFFCFYIKETIVFLCYVIWGKLTVYSKFCIFDRKLQHVSFEWM